MGSRADTEALVRLVVTSLVDEPEKVVISRQDTDGGVLFEIEVAPDDTGKVIGRQGRIIKALRTICRASGSVDGVGVDVEVVG